jgi:Tfp pilus assembly protein PilP
MRTARLLAVLILLASTSARSQTPAPAPQPAAPVTPEAATASQEKIDAMLQEEEQVLEGTGYTYDPGTRRDPFKSLLAGSDKPLLKGPRPEGIPGLMIDEVDLTGIFKTVKGYVAQVQASNKGKSFLLHEGDQLYDGDVVSIGDTEVVFKQIVNDPTALKPFREVVKKLTP